ncbi:MAG: hypothetical protein U5K74_01450 [Gemmatimonadaceae bacterium]|nr:hypothetical protein [Gemmatimonadaceae bacterium]
MIATRCRSGPAEIVRDGEDGILVPSISMPIASAVIRAMASDPERRRPPGWSPQHCRHASLEASITDRLAGRACSVQHVGAADAHRAIPSVAGGGGAERVTVNLARGFAERGHQVDLVLAQSQRAISRSGT